MVKTSLQVWRSGKCSAGLLAASLSGFSTSETAAYEADPVSEHFEAFECLE
jgi:hypothetical protein